MGEQGLERTIGDEGCYILRSEGHIICLIATHVDDCLVTVKTREILDILYKKLNQIIRVDNPGIPTKFLGIECYINKGENIILTQTNLIEKTTVTYGIAYGAKTLVKTAGIEDLLSHHNKMGPRATKRIYQSLAGSLTYIARTTRPDIAVPTSLLATRMENPSVKNFEAALRVLQYLWQTRYTSHTLSAPTKNIQQEVVIFADASYGGEDSHSQTGVIITLWGQPIGWHSRRRELLYRLPKRNTYNSAKLRKTLPGPARF
jgi:hypothetical protein